jgi:hypothetical protein
MRIGTSFLRVNQSIFYLETVQKDGWDIFSCKGAGRFALLLLGQPAKLNPLDVYHSFLKFGTHCPQSGRARRTLTASPNCLWQLGLAGAGRSSSYTVPARYASVGGLRYAAPQQPVSIRIETALGSRFRLSAPAQ